MDGTTEGADAQGMTSLGGRHRAPASTPPRQSGGRLGTAGLSLVAVLIALFGDPVASAAAAVIILVLASLLQYGNVRYGQLMGVVPRIIKVLRGSGHGGGDHPGARGSLR